IKPDGNISTVVGNGAGGFSGDGGLATAASLNGAAGVILDAGGNIYVADHRNRRVRKVDTSGIITTFAGSGATNSFGDGGPATSAGLDKPTSVAVDGADNLYIADSVGAKVRKVAPDGTISTFAGTGAPDFSGDGGPATQASLNQPKRLATDKFGNVYIVDFNNYRVRKVDPAGVITNFAGN